MDKSGGTRVVGKTIARGQQRWRFNENESWSVLTFGSFPTTKVGLEWKWVHIDKDKVPKDILKLAY